MGLFQAFSGAIGSSFADQWKDFYTVPAGITQTAAIFPAILKSSDAGRGSNFDSSDAIISNGSKIVVPEGYGLLLLEDGAITAFIGEAGGYVWDSKDSNSPSIFAGDGLFRPIVEQSWERFKFGGIPGSQQLALFVRTKELPNNKFGTQAVIYWDDAFLGTQAGAICRGTFSLIVADPIRFAKEFVAGNYLQGKQIFDFTDPQNAAASQLLAEVVGSLSAAFSLYMNDSAGENRMTKIQQDSVGFAAALSSAIESAYGWKEGRGLSISNVALVSIQYDANTAELLKTVQRADALMGTRGAANLQASVAEGIQSAGASSGAEGILGIGLAGGAIGLNGLLNSALPHNQVQDENLLQKLAELKKAFDDGLITKKEFDSAKAKTLGLN